MNSKSIKILAYISLSFLLFACSDSEREVNTESNYELIKLPDGSSAFLNHNSSIRFDYAFEKRSITQTGEVFYSVKKGNTPFTVETEQGKITVTGTEFFVKATEDRLLLEVEEGSVEIDAKGSSKKIQAGDKALVKANDNNITIGKAEFEYKKWMNELAKDLEIALDEAKETGKEIGEKSKNTGKEIGEESKKMGKDIQQGFKNLTK